MIWLLDSDIVNYILRPRESVIDRHDEAVLSGDSFALSPIVHFEVTRHLKVRNATRLMADYLNRVHHWIPVQLDPGDWDVAADLWARRRRIGRPVEDADLMIAVCALKVGATLVTNNTGHYQDLGLTLDTGRNRDEPVHLFTTCPRIGLESPPRAVE